MWNILSRYRPTQKKSYSFPSQQIIMISRLHVIISGDVQGVFFRAGAQSEAKKLDLVGWVRNNPEGSVEVMAEGEADKLKKLLEWCSRGPPGATVSKVEHEWMENKNEFRDFRLRRD